MELKAFNANGDDTPAIDLPVPTKSAQKQFIKETFKALEALDKYDAPAQPTEAYLEGRAGKYVKMLEDLIDVAADHGLLELTSSLLFGLLKLTKAGRQKADVNLTGGVSKLRDESDMANLSDEELNAILSKVKRAN